MDCDFEPDSKMQEKENRKNAIKAKESSYGDYLRFYPYNIPNIEDIFSFLNLANNLNVTNLELFNCNLGPADGIQLADGLKKNDTIIYLDLRNNTLGLGGCSAIADALTQNSTLKYLNLDSNNFGPTEANIICNALKINTTLAKITFSRNNFGDDGAVAFADMLTVNKTLVNSSLSFNRIGLRGTEAIATALTINTIIFEFNIGGNTASIHTGEIYWRVNQNIQMFLDTFWSQNIHNMISLFSNNCHKAIMTVMLINNYLPEPIFGYLLDYIFSFLRNRNFC